MLCDTENENLRLKTENAAVVATLRQERERMNAYESKIGRYESSLDTLNRQIRDKDEYISKLERDLGEKQNQLGRKEQENEKQRQKFNTKIAEQTEKKKRELAIKLNEQQQVLSQQMRSKEEKLRLVTEIVNSDLADGASSQPVSNLIHRFNSNCDVYQPQTERKTRPRVSLKTVQR